MDNQKIIIAFLKWLFIGQGIIWSFLTFYILVAEITIRKQGIGFAWIIAILFALVMTFVSNKDNEKAGSDDVNHFN